jgi:hypothetical protein
MVYLIENADEICEKFKPNTNILRGKLLRKQLRNGLEGSKAREAVARDGPPQAVAERDHFRASPLFCCGFPHQAPTGSGG